jgi:imidazole glycerol-phosphate synthase subunit HisH
MDIALLDYGTGNLHSLAKALEAGGATVRLETDPAAALAADALVLPGVGSFAAAVDRIADAADSVRDALAAGMPCLGICLGMQLLYGASDEGSGAGLGVLDGRVRRLAAPRVPHMGWNAALPVGDPLFDGADAPLVYYANSYVAEPDTDADVIAWTDYAGDRFPAAVRRGATWGVQFHPEKSGGAGLRILANWLTAARR